MAIRCRVIARDAGNKIRLMHREMWRFYALGYCRRTHWASVRLTQFDNILIYFDICTVQLLQLIFRPTNEQYIYICIILYTVSTPTCFDTLCSCDRASWVKREERKPTRCNHIDDLLSIVDVDYWHCLNMFRASLCPSSGERHLLLHVECIFW